MTLIELLIVIAVIGILMALAVPSFSLLMAKRAVTAAASDISTDFRFARSEALKRSNFVSVCRSSNTTSCDGAAGSWHTGWIVFTDKDGDGVVDGGDDVVLRVHQATSGMHYMGNVTSSSTSHRITFRPNGMAPGAADSWVLTPVSSSAKGSTRLLCISAQGRMALRAQGDITCS